MKRRFFITGTDTDVGKTVIAERLIDYFNRKGASTLGFKPISAGCRAGEEGLINEDAQTLQQASSIKVPYETVNPYAYEPPIAPHIAAQLCGDRIDFEGLDDAYRQVLGHDADITVVEGAGGWFLPVNDSQYLCDWVAREQLDVILVVGVKLGCLNHALLTQATLRSQGLNLCGWVANLIAPQTPYIEQNLDTLKRAIEAPLLATVPLFTQRHRPAVEFALPWPLSPKSE